MPIPQLSRKTKLGQYWKNGRKTYTVRSAGRSWQYRNSRLCRKGGGWRWPFNFNLPTKKLWAMGAVAVVFLSVIGFVYIAWISRNLPDPNHLLERQIAQSTTIYDRTGKDILYEVHGDEKRTLIKLSEVPDYLKWATISVEDKDFYKHGGFSFWAIFRTALTNVLFGKKAGGSTLTQQFVKNAVLTSEKTYSRKVKELILAYRIEKKFSKDEVLQMYFNEIPYGSTAYGVEAASQRYFGKSAREINLPEAAVLAALPQAPSKYSPYGPNKDLLISRQHYILDLMVKYDYIEKEKAEVAKGIEIKFKKPAENITAPHFVMYVKEQLSEKYGEKTLEQGGLKIYTTLDLYKQKIAEEAIKEAAENNEKKYDAKNAALVSLDPKTGQILAIVGSRDYFDENIDGQVNVATSLRQPGSSIKPVVYAASFLKGYTPNTVLYDVVTNFSTDPSKPYEPHDYDLKERGPVTIRQALAGSLNIPAVKTIYLAGIDNVLDLAKNLGYTSFNDKSRFGLSLVLGGGEVKLLEHTNAFSAFAREGTLHPVISILKVEDKDGNVLEEYKEEKGKKVLDANVARMINDIMSDNSARAYIFGEKNYLTLGGRPVAAKTGTTNDYHDAWTIGYTPSIVAGVWVGNSDNAAMKRGADGSVVAAPIWNAYMKKILGDTPVEGFNKPDIPKTGKPVLDGNIEGEIKVKIDRASGLLATEYTPESFTEEKIYRAPHCLLYYVNKDDPRGDAPKNPADDPQFNLWESRVQEWATKNGFIATSTPPAEYDNLHKPENRPTFSMITPTNNQPITESSLTVRVEASAPRGINRAEYYVDGNFFAAAGSYPFNLESKTIGFLGNGFHDLTVRVCDDIDNCSEQKINFNLISSNNSAGGDIGVSWLEPANGLAASAIDFPLGLKVDIINSEQTAKIIFYALKDGEKDARQIAVVSPVSASPAFASWIKTPEAGTYKLYAEARGWNGQSAKTEELTVVVK
ncbi:PBP1A family penicillin-binding protein [Candidatus Falkowbacteria bacterium]|nr:PBP1A family penicillin-binding protein [Candidatus Falkowbacteria bacterium]